MKDYILYVTARKHNNVDCDGNWDGTWETTYDYTIELDGQIESHFDGYRTSEEAQKAGERELKRLRKEERK